MEIAQKLNPLPGLAGNRRNWLRTVLRRRFSLRVRLDLTLGETWLYGGIFGPCAAPFDHQLVILPVGGPFERGGSDQIAVGQRHTFKLGNSRLEQLLSSARVCVLAAF
ncbi:MAG: hypothetical protein UZ17_ACD001002616 [Acidobacteria bacterium OLB17]|nr:MAG: hypothetical protein UZ17_ACD001002616 [Acidobacteria bacterium OLB17]